MRSGMRLAALGCLALLAPLALWSSAAEAQPSLDLRNFHPPTDPQASLYLEPTATPGPGAWNAAVWLSYAHRQIVLANETGETAVPLEHQLSLDYLASVGIGERLALGVSLPTVLYQTGDDVRPLIGDSPLPRTALGDVAFGAKATLVPTSDLGGFGLGALARVTAPTGNASSYVSDGAVTGELRLLGELRLIALDLRATAGAKIRGLERDYVGEDFGHDLPWAASLSLHPQVLGLDDKGRWQWTAEIRGAVAITPELGSAAQSPVLYGFSARYTVGDISAIGGVELPINDAVGNPSVRAVLGFGWAPRFYDQDSDGVADDLDECPELAEDKDGFEDRDGCPDGDNDDDGVADEQDRCPTEQEDEDEFEDQDGCRDPDNDKDGIADEHDGCPNERGADSPDPKRRGCRPDGDGDGIYGALDHCSNEAEDKDGFKDDDGCPDPDNDADGVLDEEDACPLQVGIHRDDPKLDGCPSPDKDGDTLDDTEDKCPAEPEDFDGALDNDGCVDDDSAKPAAQRAKPLVVMEERGRERWLSYRTPLAFVVTANSIELSPASMPTLRAIALELNRRQDWVVMVGVRPNGNGPAREQEALTKSFAIVHALRALTHRDEAAETIGWSAVQKQPGARATGIGMLVLAPPPTAATSKPAQPP